MFYVQLWMLSRCRARKKGKNMPERAKFVSRSPKRSVISTEAEPSGEIWLGAKSKFAQNPDVSTALDMTTLHKFVTPYPIRNTQYDS
jgi:hypothetical protein